MNPFALSSICIVLTALPLGYFVYWQNKNQWANKIWLFYSLALCVWGFFGFLIATTSNAEFALVYWRIAMAFGIIWMPVLFYHFAYLYAPWDEKKLLITAYIITALFSISTITPFYIPHVEFLFNSLFWSRPGIFFYLLAGWWFLLTGYSHSKLLRDSKKMPMERQNQIKYFIFASAVGYLGGLLDFGITFGLPVYPWGNFLIVLYPFIMSYAIIKHGLFDIFVFIRRAFYSAFIIGISIWIIGNSNAITTFLQNTLGLPSWIVPGVVVLISIYAIRLFVNNFERTEKIKQEFVTVAAHKLRTPLTHIRYITEELKQAKDKEETDLLIEELEESTDTLLQLINKLLDVTNLEVQSEKYEFGAIDLVAITTHIQQVTELMRKHKNITITFTAEPHIPHAEGSEKSITFAIQSFIENAIIYTPIGGNIIIKISHTKKDVVWSITDSGIGISADDKDKIFEKFFRGKNALTTDTNGTGLALFMVRNLIKRQGGVITVDSPGEGLGSRFTFTLPRASK